MASWRSANMAALLPSGTTTLLDTIRAVTSVVTTPLDLVASILDTAKALLVSLPVFDFLSTIQQLVLDFKSDFLASGLYTLDMWDFPLRQLTGLVDRDNFGPDQTFETTFPEGTAFSTFLNAIDRSFTDPLDPNRPTYTGPVSMLIIVRGSVTIESLGLSDGDGRDTIADAFPGIQDRIGAITSEIKDVRYMSMLAKIKRAAQAQSINHVQVRVERAEDALRAYMQFERDEKSVLLTPENEVTGLRFYDQEEPEKLDWWKDIAPVLESIETQAAAPQYPNWKGSTLEEIYPDLNRLVSTVLDPIIFLLQSGSTIKDQIILLIDSIALKLQQLQDLIDSIDEILDAIDRLINATGFHALFVNSTTGVTELRNRMLAATNVPFTGNNLYAGMAIVAGGSAATVFQTLFSGVGS